jgi:hypothetical protein
VLAGGVLEPDDIMQLRANLPYLIGIIASPETDDDELPTLRVVLLA